ncbi:MAG: UDP-N-acetylmuramate dehydrogenase [Erysipelotrichaceae bacterium]|nr:UDP-N-acetylmuramate dehydrogenase [Erysipelotrichaceae bacterium]MDD3809750.1 UDP-N-acetylmuramate dehydrogenase [Erysipelotrichaceae bacterium]
MNKEELKKEFWDCQILFNESLNKFTYTLTGGRGEIVFFPDTLEQLEHIVSYANGHDIPLTILGRASNVIIKDSGLEGFVVFTNHLNSYTLQGTTITAQAGASLKKICEYAYISSLTGLEFASGIPGSLGGGVYMNAGAYGGELKDVIESVTVITAQGQLKKYDREECGFDYRTSRFQSGGEIVIECSLNLKVGNSHLIKERMEQLMYLRRSRQPLEYPSCGSVFKRPEGHFTGKLIQDANLQGYKIGGAMISTKHAGFIVNVDNATATNYLELIDLIQNRIKKENDVELVMEVKVLG